MIRSGEKKEEYRAFKYYWLNRLFKGYTHVRFRNGYATNAPEFTIELLGIERGRGKLEWGAPDYCDVYILKLGKIVELNQSAQPLQI